MSNYSVLNSALDQGTSGGGHLLVMLAIILESG
jgi:hypothetical protein